MLVNPLTHMADNVNKSTVSLLQRVIEANVDPTAYPKYEIGFNLVKRESDINLRIIDRLQFRPAPNRYAFLYRHPKHWHWSGYMLVDYQFWQDFNYILTQESPMRITYACRGYDPICWMRLNTNNKLCDPVSVTGDDFWIGFGCDKDIEYEQALEYLIQTEEKLEQIANDNPPL